jgi:drug/metabolite transporter (DMT)-like permease
MKQALIQLHAAVLLWGFTAIFGRLIHLEADSLVFWRMMMALPILWLLVKNMKIFNGYSLRQLLTFYVCGAGLAAHWIFFYWSIKLSNVSIGLACFATAGFISAILEPVLQKRRPNSVELVLGLLSFLGIVIIYQSGIHYSGAIWVGLLSTFLHVSVSVINKTLTRQYEAASILFHQFCGGVIALLAYFLMTWMLGVLRFDWPSTSDCGWLLVLSTVLTIAPFLLALRALKCISAFTLNIALCLEPVYGIILAIFIFKENEQLSTSFYFGLGLILCVVAVEQVLKKGSLNALTK